MDQTLLGVIVGGIIGWATSAAAAQQQHSLQLQRENGAKRLEKIEQLYELLCTIDSSFQELIDYCLEIATDKIPVDKIKQGIPDSNFAHAQMLIGIYAAELQAKMNDFWERLSKLRIIYSGFLMAKVLKDTNWAEQYTALTTEIAAIRDLLWKLRISAADLARPLVSDPAK